MRVIFRCDPRSSGQANSSSNNWETTSHLPIEGCAPSTIRPRSFTVALRRLSATFKSGFVPDHPRVIGGAV